MSGRELELWNIMLGRLLKNRDGSVATAAGVLAIPLLVMSGFAADYAIYNQQRGALQEAADAAALASVKEMSLNGANPETIKAVAENFATAGFGDAERLSSKNSTLLVNTTPNMVQKEVTVELSYDWSPFMAHLVSRDVTPIVVDATAGLAGKSVTCIIGLMQPERLAKSSIHIDNEGRIDAGDCSVYSNSVSRYGLRADANGEVTASFICSAGGVLNLAFRRTTSFTPEPITDCPQIEDPLASRNPPLTGTCAHNDLAIESSAVSLAPGVYCGGLVVSGNSEITLSPGVYIIKDGPLHLLDQSSLRGTGVTFVLTGNDSTMKLGADTTVDLGAPETGPTAGILFFEDRNVSHSFDFNPFDLNNLPAAVRLHQISSNNARNLLGTIYLPRSILLVDANAPVANDSAYTALVVGRLWLQKGPILTINSDYASTAVPVPGGLIGKEPRLVE